jgi:hypothetical protein
MRREKGAAAVDFMQVIESCPAIERPSNVAVLRPISSSITKERDPAWFRTAAEEAPKKRS